MVILSERYEADQAVPVLPTSRPLRGTPGPWAGRNALKCHKIISFSRQCATQLWCRLQQSKEDDMPCEVIIAIHYNRDGIKSNATMECTGTCGDCDDEGEDC